jgi:glutamine---fructose-6-phosphate transaminase (isomerizing)
MCGIIGYIGEKEIVPLLIEGLKKLEYRGYDSAGICVNTDSGLKEVKRKGRISELENSQELKNIKGNIGIAHTRWATHGRPDEINSHPHFDCQKNIAIVHNGIIENYSSLKKLLISEGHNIKSQTDSEIVAHLIEKFYVGNLEEAVIKSLKLIEGAFGLAIVSKNNPEIIVARRGSPLIIGVGENEMFVASDVPAILEHTNKIIYLKDNEIAKITKENYKVKNLNGDLVDPKIHEIKWTIENLEKGNFKHFMLKEIFEQPEVIINTLRGRIKDNKIKLSVDVDPNKIRKIVITACGTSWHSALIGKYLIEKIAKMSVEVDYASEFRYRRPLINEDDLVIVISQSGETADTLAALREAKSKGARSLGIVNVVGSTITREVDSGIYLHAGPETGVASTKAFTSQVVALSILAMQLAQEKGLETDLKFLQELIMIPEKIKEVLDNSEKIKEIAKSFKNSKNFLYFGRGINFPVALEGALKLKEISYIHAEGYPAAEMKHGPIALIDEEMPIAFLATKSELSSKVLSNIEEVKARGGKLIAIANENNQEIKKFADYIIEVPETIEELSPIINVIALQLLAYYIADMKDLDVDKPRNLAKSVTVE